MCFYYKFIRIVFSIYIITAFKYYSQRAHKNIERSIYIKTKLLVYTYFHG